jgi:hypothetical protein
MQIVEAQSKRKTECRLLIRVLVFSFLAGGCASAQGLQDFTSDGCSLFLGRQCMFKRTKNKVLAKLMYKGAKGGGHTTFPYGIAGGMDGNMERDMNRSRKKEQQ